jgi:hypothetical protein
MFWARLSPPSALARWRLSFGTAAAREIPPRRPRSSSGIGFATLALMPMITMHHLRQSR